eukprot:TRINITY_DN29321_c0_g2_i1.p1 TRINITY_DN29321_c0_g2~~TRINITY_DN29321_c0_g2_i1.p1  ORF type:complete len:842 (+),score=111.45 TRINITY_DN29321_c0_g2_i1:140-2665(+)
MMLFSQVPPDPTPPSGTQSPAAWHPSMCLHGQLQPIVRSNVQHAVGQGYAVTTCCSPPAQAVFMGKCGWNARILPRHVGQATPLVPSRFGFGSYGSSVPVGGVIRERSASPCASFDASRRSPLGPPHPNPLIVHKQEQRTLPTTTGRFSNWVHESPKISSTFVRSASPLVTPQGQKFLSPVMHQEVVPTSPTFVLNSPELASGTVDSSQTSSEASTRLHDGCRTAPPTCSHRAIRCLAPPLSSPLPPQENVRRVALPSSCAASQLPPLAEQDASEEEQRFMENLDIHVKQAKPAVEPSHPSILSHFLSGVVSGDIVPAMCRKGVHVDISRYWEKRRVQNLLRHLLEAIEKRFDFQSSSASMENGSLGSAVFDAFVDWARQHGEVGLAERHGVGQCDTLSGGLSSGALASVGLCEHDFIRSLDAFGCWPPEISAAERKEVFVAFLAPNSAAVRSLFMGQPLPKELSKRMFCEGLSRIPFNGPEFSVPANIARKLGAVRLDDVAREIASLFWKNGTWMVKDFFLCGLISLEEIQVALPYLVPQDVVEAAVRKVISAGIKRFTRLDLATLLGPLEMLAKESVSKDLDQSTLQASTILELSPLPSLSSPIFQDQEILFTPDPQREHFRKDAFSTLREGIVPVRLANEIASASERADTRVDVKESAFWFGRPESVLMGCRQGCGDRSSGSRSTDLQTRSHDLMRDDLGTFLDTDASQGGNEFEASLSLSSSSKTLTSFLIDWSTTRGTDASALMGQSVLSVIDAGHQADQGAGSPQICRAGASSIDLEHWSKEAPISFCSSALVRDPQEPPPLISLGLHDEFSGPFLAHAFFRCCQLYEITSARQL